MAESEIIPQDVSDLDLAFAPFVKHLMPDYADIPKEFKGWNRPTKWNQLTSDWFYNGVKNLEFTPKEGIDISKAFRHIKAIMGSFEPKHEHKEAACAYLMSLWFEDAKWERSK